MSNRRASATGSSTNRIAFIRQFGLIRRLLADSRVSPWLKGIVPALALAYLLLPWDLVTDFIPVLGQLDDLAVLLLGMQLFIRLVPTEIVQEHLGGRSSGSAQRPPDDDVIDAAYRVVEEDDA